ncbi:hypothetical protein E2I00_008508 [Balaenoptera physalus]|uniref:Cdc42 effector-like domain-containing protein n=1 Tax=Balaenoptera physalus TaxID=9770 RepID=A0A643CDL1_BALPH|nr:hypothetical protein E2I00_008508 [Balaenoptera physalus]
MFDHSAPCELVKEKTKSEESLSDLTGSLLSLQLDLGPSFLDEVLNVMDRSFLCPPPCTPSYSEKAPFSGEEIQPTSP